MAEKIQEENPACVEMNGRNEPEMVSCDIENEHRPPAFDFDHVGLWKISADLSQRFPTSLA